MRPLSSRDRYVLVLNGTVSRVLNAHSLCRTCQYIHIFSTEAMEKKHKTKSKKYRSGGNVGHLHCLQQKVINFNTPMRKPIISTI